MADWPANGVTDWNTKMKANIDVGHDSGGTHKKSQMLTDMDWSPTTMTGANESNGEVTFPNGLQLKWGDFLLLANTSVAKDLVDDFGLTDFTNSCFQVVLCGSSTDINNSITLYVSSITVTGFTATNEGNANDTARWFAIGR